MGRSGDVLSPADTPEPAPTPGTGDVWLDVIGDIANASGWLPIFGRLLPDMAMRRAEGIRRYKTPLQYGNGRRPRVDLYQELLDACAYARQGGEPWWIRWPIVALAWAIRRRIPTETP